MSRPIGHFQRGILPSILVAVAVAVGGCGGATASPAVTTAATESPTPSPAPSPTPTPTPRPSPTPSASPKVDPTVGLAIAAPYELADLDPITAAEIDAGLQTALGSMASAIQIGVRTVTKDGQNLGLAMVLRFPDAAMVTLPGFIDSMAGGVAGENGKVTKATILGQPVRLITSPNGAYALFFHGESAIFAVAETLATAKAIATALIKKNR